MRFFGRRRRRCHILREDRAVYCGLRRRAGLIHGGLAVADCERCLRAAVAAGELAEWLKMDTHSDLVRSVQRATLRRLRRLGIAVKKAVETEEKRRK